jgi:hypothetical protein
MDENPYRSPECSDQQEQTPQAGAPRIPTWVVEVLLVIALIATLLALFAPGVHSAR